MKKIAIVTQDIYAGGGVPSVVRFLYGELQYVYSLQLFSVSTSMRDDCSVRLLKPSTWLQGIKCEQDEWEGRHVIKVGANLTEFEFQRYMPRAVLTSQLNQFDAVIVVAGGPAWAYLAKHVMPPVFLQMATLVEEERKQLLSTKRGLKKIYLEIATLITGVIEKKALRVVDAIFVENFWLLKQLSQELGENKVVMAPPGVDTEFFSPSDSVLLGNEEGDYIISVGRFNDRRKNVQLMFAAYAQLRKINSNAPKLVLAGLWGPTEADWQVAKNLKVDRWVEFKEKVPRAELVELICRAKAFVCSSEEEGLGIAMMEALSCGVPVVTTDCGGPETFMVEGRNGFTVGKTDHIAMAERINLICTDNAMRKTMRQFSRQHMVDNFSKEITAKKFIEKIDEFL